MSQWSVYLDDDDTVCLDVRDQTIYLDAQDRQELISALQRVESRPISVSEGLSPGDRVIHRQRGRVGTVHSAASLDMGGDHAWNILLDGNQQPNRVTAQARELTWATD